MIGAPSDIQEEVGIARRIIHQWNDNHSRRHRTVLLPAHWTTNTYPAAGKRPQAIINDQVTSKSDMLVCIFGIRLGTPTGEAESGTLEEIKEHLDQNKPVMVFFKTGTNDTGKIDLGQFAKLTGFKAEVQKTMALTAEFESSADFEKQFDSALQKAANDYFVKELKSKVPEITLTEDETDRLKKWTLARNPSFYSLSFEGGGKIIHLGSGNEYEVKPGRDMALWNSFFEKLERLGFAQKRYGKNGEIYELKTAAYQYVDSLPKEQ